MLEIFESKDSFLNLENFDIFIEQAEAKPQKNTIWNE